MRKKITEKKNKKLPLPALRLPAVASLWYTLSSFISRGISFCLTPIFTRILSGAEYGVYPLYTSWFSVLSAFMTLDAGGAVLYGGFAKFKSADRSFTKSALISLLSVFLAFSVPYFIFIKKLSHVSKLPIFLLVILALHILAEAVISLFCTKERFFYGYKRVFAANVLPAIVAPLLALSFIHFVPSYARSLAAALTSLGTVAVLFISSKQKLGGYDPKMVRYVLRSCIRLFPYFVSTVLLANADKLMIGRYFGGAALAKYSVAHSLGLILTFLTVGLLGALKPWIMRRLSMGDTESVGRTVGLLFSLFSALTLGLAAIAPEIFSFLAPREYEDALIAVFAFALAVLPMFLCNIFSSVLMFLERSWTFSLATLLCAFINIGLNYALFGHFSFSCAAFSFLISYIILSLTEWFATKSLKIISGKIFAVMFLVAIAVFALYFFKNYTVLRIFMAIAIVPPTLLISYRIFGLIKEK